MNQETVIRTATFDPRVKTYWLLSGALLLVLTIVFIPLLLLWFPIGLVFTGRYLARMECVLTPKSLKVKKGVLVRVEKTIPLEKITDMAIVQGPIMRWLDIERLTVETAGQSGAGALVSLTGIVQAKEFRELVLTQRDLMSDRPDPEATHTAPANAGPVMAEIRDSLLRIEGMLAERAGKD